MEELEWLNLKIAKAMSPAGAMWLRDALEQRLETEHMPMLRDAMPDGRQIGVEPIEYRLNFRFAEQAIEGGVETRGHSSRYVRASQVGYKD